MVKKLKKDSRGLTLHIDQSIADDLGITEKTDIELIVTGDTIVIKPKNVDSDVAKKRQEKIKEVTKRLMSEYDPVLKKLAKT